MSQKEHRPGPAAILLVPVVAAVVLTLFAWPSARLEPRDLPIGVAGRGAQALERRLCRAGGRLRRASLRRRGRGARRDRGSRHLRRVRGQAGGVKVLTASAASPAVAQLIARAAAEAPQGRTGGGRGARRAAWRGAGVLGAAAGDRGRS